MIDSLVDGFESSLLRHMPGGPYRDFYLWSLSYDNPRREAYLLLVGLVQFAKMTQILLDGLVDDSDWEALIERSIAMNAYLVYETVSDNLAIGLRTLLPTDRTFQLRKNLVYAFNNAMLKRLNGDRRPAAALLEVVQPGAHRVSSYEHSLSRAKHIDLVRTYLGQYPNLSYRELEYSTWPMLVANIEACLDMMRSIRTFRGAAIVQDGLVKRYQAVNKLLKAGDMTLSQLANIGTYSILVMPTLAYYIVVLTEIIRPQPRIAELIDNGSLSEALYDAALLLRLLNDLGTDLCMLSNEGQARLLERLRDWHVSHPQAEDMTFDLLLVVDSEASLLTRLHKDVMFGEFNVSLYGLSDATSMLDAITTFGRNIKYFSQLYEHHYAHLLEKLEVIDAHLHDSTVSKLILRFVKFHEKMYATSFHSNDGDYAV